MNYAAYLSVLHASFWGHHVNYVLRAHEQIPHKFTFKVYLCQSRVHYLRARPTKEVENIHIRLSAIPSHFGFRSESPIHSDYDVLLMGDMLYDEEIGSKVTQLSGSFRGLTLVGDPGKVQGDHSSSSQPPVDIKTKVAFQYKQSRRKTLADLCIITHFILFKGGGS